MGAHNLGEAHFGNSGFSGTWVSNEQVWQGLIKHQHECYTVNILQFYFNNQYYTNLLNTSLDWQLEQSSCGTSVNNSVTNRDNVDTNSGNVDNEAAETRGCTPGQQADWHWTAASRGFSLHTDMALLKVTHPQDTQCLLIKTITIFNPIMSALYC